MTTHEDLVLDDDGVPVLTDIVAPDEYPEPEPAPLNRLAAMSVEDMTRTVMDSDSLHPHLDEIAADLSRNFHQQLDQLLRPAIEQAITEVMDDSGNAAYAAIRERLETALPEMLARTLHEEAGRHN